MYIYSIFTAKMNLMSSEMWNCVSSKEHGGEEITIVNPAQFPDKAVVSEYLEPVVLGTILTPDSYTGKIMSMCLVRETWCEGKTALPILLGYTLTELCMLHLQFMFFCCFFYFCWPGLLCVFCYIESKSHPKEHGVHWWPARYDEVSLPIKWNCCRFLWPAQVSVLWICKVTLSSSVKTDNAEPTTHFYLHVCWLYNIRPLSCWPVLGNSRGLISHTPLDSDLDICAWNVVILVKQVKFLYPQQLWLWECWLPDCWADKDGYSAQWKTGGGTCHCCAQVNVL